MKVGDLVISVSQPLNQTMSYHVIKVLDVGDDVFTAQSIGSEYIFYELKGVNEYRLATKEEIAHAINFRMTGIWKHD